MFDFGPFAGDPDLASHAPGAAPLCSTTSSGSVHIAGRRSSPPAFWFAGPTECGPYPAGGAPAGTATVAMMAQTKPFDQP